MSEPRFACVMREARGSIFKPSADVSQACYYKLNILTPALKKGCSSLLAQLINKLTVSLKSDSGEDSGPGLNA